MPYSISNFLYKRTLLPKALFADDVSGFRAGLRSTNTSDTWINDSDIFWSTPPRRWKPSGLRYKLIELFRPQLYVISSKLVVLYLTSYRARRQLAVSFVLIMIGLACGFYSPFRIRYTYSESVIESSHSIRPVLPPFQRNEADPIRWIKENSNDKYAVPTSLLPSLQFNRPRAALISLVRNAELPGMIESIQQMERRWNEKYQVANRIVDKAECLTNCSTLGSSLTMNLSQKNSKRSRKMQPRRNVTMQSSQKSTGRFLAGLMKAGF